MKFYPDNFQIGDIPGVLVARWESGNACIVVHEDTNEFTTHEFDNGKRIGSSDFHKSGIFAFTLDKVIQFTERQFVNYGNKREGRDYKRTL
jgi:hypothetical protein